MIIPRRKGTPAALVGMRSQKQFGRDASAGTPWRGCVCRSVSRDQLVSSEVFLVVRALPRKVWL